MNYQLPNINFVIKKTQMTNLLQKFIIFVLQIRVIVTTDNNIFKYALEILNATNTYHKIQSSGLFCFGCKILVATNSQVYSKISTSYYKTKNCGPIKPRQQILVLK